MVCTAAPRAWAQTGFVENFIVEAKQNKAYLRWTMSMGRTCNGIEISRSADAVNYTPIGEIFGVCGSTDSAQAFVYTDDNPEKNKTNFYKLTFGTTGLTAVQSTFVLGDGDYVLYPNPANSTSLLQFDNKSAFTATMSLYSIDGRLVSSMNTKSDKFEINTAFMPMGIYLFVLTTKDNVRKGKLLVVH